MTARPKGSHPVARLTDGWPKPYTSIGSYPIAYLIEGCGRYGVLCPDCAGDSEAEDDAAGATRTAFLNWEDPDLYCDDCGERIKSAYAEPDGPSDD